MGSTKLLLRSIFGGTLMGLANLVPGISGGTMLLAAGIYPRFIEAVADVTRFRFRWPSLFLLGSVAVAAGISILLFAGPIKQLVVEQRWIMYSLFIGLTLGGVPVVWRMTNGWNRSLAISAVLAFSAMVGLALLQAFDVVGDFASNPATFFVAGLAGASAMILPGLSGGYLLLLLGQYVPILAAIDQFKEALKAKDIATLVPLATSVILPVGIGVVVGVAVVGNLLQWLLKNQRNATLGVLLGLLVGSGAGLYPFQQGVEPQLGDRIKGQVVTTENQGDFDQEDWKTVVFTPSMRQVLTSLALIGVGFAVTLGIERIGSEDSGDESDSTQPSSSPSHDQPKA